MCWVPIENNLHLWHWHRRLSNNLLKEHTSIDFVSWFCNVISQSKMRLSHVVAHEARNTSVNRVADSPWSLIRKGNAIGVRPRFLPDVAPIRNRSLVDEAHVEVWSKVVQVQCKKFLLLSYFLLFFQLSSRSQINLDVANVFPLIVTC